MYIYIDIDIWIDENVFVGTHMMTNVSRRENGEVGT